MMALLPQEIERLIMLVTVANYDGDTDLRTKLESLLRNERARAFLNQRDEHGKEIPIDGKRRSS